MLSETHWKISEVIIHGIKSGPIPIDSRSFTWGCCLPDIFWGGPDHIMDKSFDYLTRLLGELHPIKSVSYTVSDNRCFSFKLGIAVHYICDYFCWAHNARYYENIFHHLLYENRLQTEFNRHHWSQLIKRAGDSRQKDNDLTPRTLPDFIQSQHLIYLAEAPDIKNDIYFAVYTAGTVVNSLLNRQMQLLFQAA